MKDKEKISIEIVRDIDPTVEDWEVIKELSLIDEIAAHTRDFSHELAAKEQLKFELTYVNMYIKSEST